MPNPAFSNEFYNKWEHLINDVEVSEVPMRFIKEVIVYFESGDTVEFDIGAMMDSGNPADIIEEEVEAFLSANDEYINNVDFHINIPAVADEINNKTSKLLDT